MPATNEQVEIQKMTAIANNEEQKPEVRINAARRLLRKTNFSSRSVRVGKRIAKLYFSNQDVSSQVREKAASLLEFVLSKPADDGSPLEELTPVTPAMPAVPMKDTFIYDYKKIFWVTVGYEGVNEEETYRIRDEVYQKYGTDRALWARENGKLKRTKFGEEVYAEFMAAIAAAVAKKKAEAGSSLWIATQENHRWE